MNKLITLYLFILFSSNLYSQSFSRMYQESGCGLNYVHKSIPVSGRAGSLTPGNPMPVSLNISEMPGACFKVEAAYVWWVVSYLPETPKDGILTITNPEGITSGINAVLTGSGRDKCWGESGTRGYRADVKDLISGNGNYVLSVNTGNYETDGLTLLVIYRDLSANYSGQVIIDDGLFVSNGTLTATDTLKDFLNPLISHNSSGFMIVSDLEASKQQFVTFSIDSTDYLIESNFWNSEVMPKTIEKNDTQAVFSIKLASDSDCFAWQMTGLYLQNYSLYSCPNNTLPVIKALGPTSICPCESVELDAGDRGYISYLWSTGDTTRKISVSNEGSYTVTVVDSFGCELTSYNIDVKYKQPRTVLEIQTDNIEPSTGDTIHIPVIMKYSENLAECGETGYTAVISFDKSLFMPVGDYPKGTIDGNRRYLTLKGKRTGTSGVLFYIDLVVTLGDAEQADIKFESFAWDECPSFVRLSDGSIPIKGFCDKGGRTRLFMSGSSPLLLSIRPNPAGISSVIDYNLVEKGYTRIFVMDMLGREVKTIFEGNHGTSMGQITPDLSELASGMYILVLKTPNDMISNLFVIKK